MYTLEKDNSRADTLSYRHDIARTKKIINTVILKVNDNKLLELARTLNLLMRISNDVLKE